jgi:hypothetical protein
MAISQYRHGLKRMPVAFVPFGVSAMNFIGLTRLVTKILFTTGMAKDHATKATGVSLAGQAYAKVLILDNIGDMYQLLAAGTIAYSLTSAVAMGTGLSEAVNALAITDFALLGSVSVVTGAIAALGAALTRPHMVSMLADLIATLQTLWLLFPPTRRQASTSEVGRYLCTDVPVALSQVLHDLPVCYDASLANTLHIRRSHLQLYPSLQPHGSAPNGCFWSGYICTTTKPRTAVLCHEPSVHLANTLLRAKVDNIQEHAVNM